MKPALASADMSHKTLPIHEVFMTFQGEGVHMGKPAFFIRTFGCPVKCDFCDSAGTWHPDYIPKDIERAETVDLVNQVIASCGTSSNTIVVITGGEPAIHDLTDLTTRLRACGFRIHLETSGAFPLKGVFDWITLSPKRWKLPLAENVQRADEFKIIVGAEAADDISYYHLQLVALGLHKGPSRPIWLHPEWSQHTNTHVLAMISAMVKSAGSLGDFRAGWQLHKLYAVDALDKRSRPLVPLGGNPEKGF
jgi:7-carboxy-7-deazaguanine synthase